MKTSPLRKITFSLVVAISIGFPGILRAELGHNNPTGVSGEFNGNVTTGCSYDPFTGNATRSITDIVVPGAVGAYPLAFTRTMDTRTAFTEGNGAFGRPGGWRHSYQWGMAPVLMTFDPCAAGGVPDHYAVAYPDGREARFDGAGRSTTLGVGDSIIPLTNPTAPSGDCYLVLSDGGRVHFTAEIDRYCDGTGYQTEFIFRFVAIIDPYGQETTISETSGPGPTPTTATTKITEPKGRNLSLCWIQYRQLDAIWVLKRVEERPTPTADASRTVTYNYENYNGDTGDPALTSVEYFGDATLTALYSYQESNRGSSYPPLIKTCNDTMYGGAMSKIAYDFNFATDKPHGFLLAERYFNGVDATSGPAVSTLSAPYEGQRIEIRGDGPRRTFLYNSDLGLLMSWTDFQEHGSSQEHYIGVSPVGFVKRVTDARGKYTDFERAPVTGKITEIKYPWTESDPQGMPGKIMISYDPSPSPSPSYHVATVTDERRYITTYSRDGSGRVKDIYYPDLHPPLYIGSHEGFAYDSLFGQLKRHQRQNGKYEHLDYDPRGLLMYKTNPTSSETAPTTGLPKTTFEYYPLNDPWRDRVKIVTDPRGKTTTFEYDRLSPPPGQNEGPAYAGRGLVSKIIHHDTTYLSFGYDERGNKVWEENELRQRTTYIYDDYNRIIEIQTPLPPNTPGNHIATTTYVYSPNSYINTLTSPYLHTTRAVTRITNPTGIVTTKLYDENFRLKETKEGAGTPDAATTRYDYDEVGNLKWVKDPRGYETVIENDERNRRTKVTGPPIADAGDTYVTEWRYDPASNVSKITLPDGSKLYRDYDEVNRLSRNDLTNPDEQQHRVTQYTYWPSGRLRAVVDPNIHTTEFEYDERDLKTKMTYPGQTPLQGWQYDENGNLKERPTIGGEKQRFSYDDRNRLKTMRWSTGIDFSDFDYNAAGQLTSAINPYSTITRDYDEGGRLKFDRQVLAANLNPPSMTIAPTGVKSRKSHASAGSFDINLPLTGTPGIECRLGPSYTLVLTFADNVSVGGATVNSGIGNVASITALNKVVTVNLTDVSDAQLITVRVFGLSDGTNAGDVIVPMHVLIGDTVEHGVVNGDDLDLTGSRSGQVTDLSNFRSDVNTDGVINGSDVAAVGSWAGTSFEITTGHGVVPQAEVSYEYYDDGRRKKLWVLDPEYSYDYSYDGQGRLKTIFQTDSPFDNYYQYSYDASSNVIGRRSNASDTSLSFVSDEINRIKEETIFLANGNPFSHLHYRYDKMSRLESTTRDEVSRDRFEYNFAGELTYAAYRLTSNGQGGWQHGQDVTSYFYDNAGNRTSVIGATYTAPYTPNLLNQYTAAPGSTISNGPQHEISGYDGVNYTYFADTQLRGVSSGVGEIAADTYRLGYDALGRTVRRTTNGEATYSIYDGAHPILEYDGSKSPTSTLYGLGVDEIIFRDNHGAGEFFMQDRLGSTIAVTSSNGELLEKYRYDAFGTPEVMYPSGTPTPGNESTINNRVLFAGREWVSHFGFYENRARAYHPGLGRFMSEDLLGFHAGDANLYRYCRNDPLNRRDPSGLVDDDMHKYPMAEPIIVRASEIPNYDASLSRDVNPLERSGGVYGEGHVGAGASTGWAERARDFLAERHPELNVDKREMKEAPLPGDKMGETDPRTKEITLDPINIGYEDLYVEAYAHELMHANQSTLQNLLDSWAQKAGYITPNHNQIYQNAIGIGREYAHEHPGG